MADIFYTLLIIWVLWRIFGGATKTYVFHQHRHQHDPPKKREGDVSVTYKKEEKKNKSGDSGEYIDYEEIK
jgi:hypothetical protein